MATKPTPSSAMPRQVLANVQFLRAIAALMVVVVHLRELFVPLGAEAIDTEMFSAGVDLFFVISGFIMVYTTERRPLTPGAFFVNRLIRVVPIYWLLTLVVFAIAAAVPGLFGGTIARWPDLLCSLGFIPYERGDGSMRPMLFVGWSLNLEMMFYALFAASLYLPARACRECLLVALLCGMVLWHVSNVGFASPVALFLTQPMILDFALGVLLAKATPFLPANRPAGLVAVGVIPLALLALLAMIRFGSEAPVRLIAIPAGIVVAAALVAERGGLRLAGARWIAIGNASYVLYLVHPFVTQAVTKVAAVLGGVTPMMAPLFIGIAFTLVVITALAVHHWIERPIGRRLHRMVASPRSANSGLAQARL